jgi:hypothetical protein
MNERAIESPAQSQTKAAQVFVLTLTDDDVTALRFNEGFVLVRTRI